MATATVRLPLTASRDAVLDALRDYAGWQRWMPGLVAVAVEGDEVRWSIQAPTGVAVVPLRFRADDDGVSFESTAGDGPFTRIAGRVAADGLFELTLEGTPPPPAEMAQMLARSALAQLQSRLADAGPRPLAAPMSDGVSLAVHHYPVEGVAPAVLLVIPYRKESAFMPLLAANINGGGYHFLVADVRGFGGSDAPYLGLLSEREVQDHVELIEWAAAQPFCDGNVATTGASYCGANQLLAAARRPPSLRCITPIVGPIDTFRDWTHRGGIPSHTLWGAMTYLSSQHPATAQAGTAHYYGELLASPLDDDGHRARSPEYGLDRIEVPTLCVGGWHDYFLRATVRTYQQVRAPKRLVVGPWGHGDPAPMDELLGWFDRWLRGGPEGGATGVKLYCVGADQWREHDDWPAPESRQWEAWHPVDEAVAVRVVTHPMAVMPAPNPRPQFLPDPTDSGMSLWGEDAVFDSAPLAEDRVLEGHVAAHVSVAVEGCEDVNVFVRLSVVDGDGAAEQVTEGRLRAGHRAVDLSRSVTAPDGEVVVPWHPHDRLEPVPNGEPFEAAVEVYPVCRLVRAGQRLRLGLTIARADEGAVAAPARLLPETRVLLPWAP